jgi:hypothetical protein
MRHLGALVIDRRDVRAVAVDAVNDAMNDLDKGRLQGRGILVFEKPVFGRGRGPNTVLFAGAKPTERPLGRPDQGRARRILGD